MDQPLDEDHIGRLEHGCAILIIALMMGVTLIPIIYNTIIGFSTRFIADEFLTFGALKQYGFWGSQTYWYTHWSGRYAFTLTINLVELFDLTLFPVLPMVTLAVWSAAVAWLAGEIFRLAEVHRPWLWAWVVSLFILFGTLSTVPNLSQDLFWVTGIITYLFPLIGITGLCAWILSQARRDLHILPPWARYGIGFLCAFWFGGFSETSLTYQFILFVSAMVFVRIALPQSIRRRIFPLVLAACLGTLLSLAVVGLAPGNAVRVGNTQARQGILWAIPATLNFVAYYLRVLLANKRFALVLVLGFSLILGILIGTASNKTRARSSFLKLILNLVLGFAFCLLVITGVFFPSLLMLSDGPPQRAQIISQFAFMLYWVTAGIAAGTWSGHALQGWLRNAGLVPLKFALLALTLVLAYPMVGRINGFHMQLNEARAYAEKWDDRDQALREAAFQGTRKIQVKRIYRADELSDLYEDPQAVNNVGAAQYYGLDEITAR